MLVGSWSFFVSKCPKKMGTALKRHKLSFDVSFDVIETLHVHHKIQQINMCLRNRSAPAVNCCLIIHCLEVSCKENQITSAQREWFIFAQLTDKQWIITQQFTQWSWSISILTHNKRRKHIRSIQLLPTFRHCTEELPPIFRLRRIRLHVIVTSFKRKNDVTPSNAMNDVISSDVSYHTLYLWIIVRYITVCYRWLYRRGMLEYKILQNDVTVYLLLSIFLFSFSIYYSSHSSSSISSSNFAPDFFSSLQLHVSVKT